VSSTLDTATSNILFPATAGSTARYLESREQARDLKSGIAPHKDPKTIPYPVVAHSNNNSDTAALA